MLATNYAAKDDPELYAVKADLDLTLVLGSETYAP